MMTIFDPFPGHLGDHQVLERLCQEIKRDCGNIERSILTPVYIRTDPAEVKTLLERIAGLRGIPIEEAQKMIKDELGDDHEQDEDHCPHGNPLRSIDDHLAALLLLDLGLLGRTVLPLSFTFVSRHSASIQGESTSLGDCDLLDIEGLEGHADLAKGV